MMNQPSRFYARLLVPISLFCSGMFLTGGAEAVVTPPDPVEITFESTSPYYQPPVVVVSVGTPVRWVNVTGSHHSVRHDGCLTDEVCAFQSIAVSPDSSFLIAPLPPGRYDYHCELHPIMRGTLIVTDPLLGGRRDDRLPGPQQVNDRAQRTGNSTAPDGK